MKLKNGFLLFMAAFIWGIAFVAQSVGMDYVGPFTFNGIRSLIGSFVLFLFLQIRRIGSKKKEQGTEDKKTLILGGVVCGIFLTIASTLQQIGIMYTTVGKAGFITALYIIFVPILQMFSGKKVGMKIWLSVALGALGLYLLCMKESFILQKGDFLVILCAIVFAFHILVIDYFSPKVDGVKLSCMQFLVCGIVCCVVMAFTEKIDINAMIQGAVPILYAGIFSCGVAYTVQIVGQKNMNPTIASLILSLESVVSAIAGFLILKQSLTVRETAGCVLMFAAIILAQIVDLNK